MKNMKRQRRRMATLKKIRQRERFLHHKLGGQTYWSHWDQELDTRWDKRTYNRMKSQFPFSGEFRRDKEEFGLPHENRKVLGDEGFEGAEPDCKSCFYCNKIKEIKVGDVCEGCISFLEDLVWDNFYSELDNMG